ncbi:MAG TPA: pilus assembly protein PilM [Candidatus Paceibacterota bacterium]|nr:pilus assembly protein PilM [Candidatus Paceibacterota bacterium]
MQGIETPRVRHARAEGEPHGMLAQWFPTPSILVRVGAGVDISDSSIKWIELVPAVHGWEVGVHGHLPLPEGVVVEGSVRDAAQLGAAIAELREQVGGSSVVHAALPEEAGYVFSMTVPEAGNREEVLHMVEFELEGRVPLKVNQAIYDYDIVGPTEEGIELAVSVFPSALVDGYLQAFAAAGIELRSLEVEARAIARAVVPADAADVSLLVDFGRARTGFAILKRGMPIFTDTVAVGGAKLTETVMGALGVGEADANEFKDTIGLLSTDDARVHEVVAATAATLADEVLRHYRYWDTRRNEEGKRVTPVARVLLAGGSATLKGLPEYLASRVQAPAALVDVWRNVCSFDEYIPPIERKASLGYATAIGLALRGA